MFVILGIAALLSVPPDSPRLDLTSASTPHTSGILITNSDAISFLRGIEAAQDGAELELQVTTRYGEGGSTPPEVFNESHFVQRLHVRQLVEHEQYRIVSTFVETNVHLAALKGQVHTMTWNGEQARLTTRGSSSSNPAQQNARIDNVPTRDVRDLPTLTYCGLWVLQNSEFTSYSDLLATASPMGEPASDDEQTTEWTLASPALSNTIIRIRMARTSSGLALLGAHQECYSTSEAMSTRDPAAIILRTSVVYGPADAGMSGLPRSARILHQHCRKNPVDGFWGASDVQLISTAKVEHDDAAFLAPLDDNAIVGDSRLNIAYHLGSTHINIDGRLLETQEPLKGDVGAKLSWWIAHGHFIDTTPPRVTTAPTTPAKGK